MVCDGDDAPSLYETPEAIHRKWRLRPDSFGSLYYRCKRTEAAWEADMRRAERLDQSLASTYYERAPAKRFVPFELHVDRLEIWHRANLEGRFDAQALAAISQRIVDTYDVAAEEVDLMTVERVAEMLERLPKSGTPKPKQKPTAKRSGRRSTVARTLYHHVVELTEHGIWGRGHKEIANAIGSTRETVCRLLKNEDHVDLRSVWDHYLRASEGRGPSRVDDL